jgi:hypothetical protein
MSRSIVLAHHQTSDKISTIPFSIPINDVQYSHAILSSNEAKSSFILSNENSIFLYNTELSPKPERLVKPSSARIKQITVWRNSLILFEDGQAYSLDTDGVFEKIQGGPFDYVCSGYSYTYLKQDRIVYQRHGNTAVPMQTLPNDIDTPIKIDAGYDQVILLTGKKFYFIFA